MYMTPNDLSCGTYVIIQFGYEVLPIKIKTEDKMCKAMIKVNILIYNFIHLDK